MTKNVKKPVPRARKQWKALSAQTYQKVLGKAVHFSGKTINSNAPACGVRLPEDTRLELPYVALSTLDVSAVPLDYAGDAAGSATVFAQATAIRDVAAEEQYEEIPAGDRENIREALEMARLQGYEAGCEVVSKRLRQIIVQDVRGDDVTLTPLQSAGFSLLLNERLNKRLEAGEGFRKRGILGIGGANPQNVGAHVRAMGQPLVFYAPEENLSLRRALAIHYRGIAISIAAQPLLQYHDWRTSLLKTHGGRMPSDRGLRDWEETWIKGVTKSVLTKAASATAILDDHLSELPGNQRMAIGVPLVIRGLTDDRARNDEWPSQFARSVRDAILNTKFRPNGEQWDVLNVDQDATDRWLDVIEDMVR